MADLTRDRFLSVPVPVHWAGWKSDTYTLQQAGWSISAHQHVERMDMSIAMSHREFGHGFSNYIDWRYYEDFNRSWTESFPPIFMKVMGRPVTVHTQNMDWGAYEPIDARPQFADTEVRTLTDLVHFAPNLARTKEIIIPEESVDDLLSRIIDLQQPDRTERLKQMVRNPEGYKPEAVPREKVHAQILSLVA